MFTAPSTPGDVSKSENVLRRGGGCIPGIMIIEILEAILGYLIWAITTS